MSRLYYIARDINNMYQLYDGCGLAAEKVVNLVILPAVPLVTHAVHHSTVTIITAACVFTKEPEQQWLARSYTCMIQ